MYIMFVIRLITITIIYKLLLHVFLLATYSYLGSKIYERQKFPVWLLN